jgi:hypothetical protein
MSELVDLIRVWPNEGPSLLLLMLAGLLHGLVLWGRRASMAKGRGAGPAAGPLWADWATGLAELTLLLVCGWLGLRALGVNEPGAWLTGRSDQTLRLATWMMLLLYLLLAHWWRRPGLGLALAALLLLPLLLSELSRDVLVTRGLPLNASLRPIYLGLAVAVLALTGLALAGQLAGWATREGWSTGLLLGAWLLHTGQLGLLAIGWVMRPGWTLPQSWLVASWLLLLLALLASWRTTGRPVLLTALAGALLVLALAVVPQVVTRL